MNRATWCTLAAACGLALTTNLASAQQQQQAGQQQQQGPTGAARVVQRQGPRVELKQGHRPVACVVFSNAQTSQAQGEGLIISVLQTGGQDATQDKEALFEARNAQNGIVSHDFGQLQGGAENQKRALVVTARRGNETVQVDQLGGAGQNAYIFAVKRQQPQQQQQPGVAAAGQQGQQQGQQGQGQQAQAGQQPADQAQQAAAKQAAEQAQKQQQEAAQKKAQMAPTEEHEAVMFIYLVGSAQQQ
jgi:hypothetical protein